MFKIRFGLYLSGDIAPPSRATTSDASRLCQRLPLGLERLVGSLYSGESSSEASLLPVRMGGMGEVPGACGSSAQSKESNWVDVFA